MSAQILLEQIEGLAPEEQYWLYEVLTLRLQAIASSLPLRLLDKVAKVIAYCEREQLLSFAEIINKIQFTDSVFEVDWRIGMGINLEDELQIVFTIKLDPVQEKVENFEKKQVIMPFFTKLLERLQPDDLENIEKALDNILENMQKPYHLDLGMMPLLFLDRTSAVLSCRIKGKILATVSH